MEKENLFQLLKSKKLILILTILAFGFGCKKEEKCLVGGKWYHVESVIGAIELPNNNYGWVEFNSDGFAYFSNGTKKSYIVTDNKLNKLPYICNGKELKIHINTFIEYVSIDPALNADLDNNYIMYKR